MKVVISDDMKLAAEQLQLWEYPFNFKRYDVKLLLQVSNASDSVAWVWYEEFGGTDLVIHVCANPKYRGRCFTRHVYRCMVWAAKLLGKDRIYTLAKDGTDVVKYVKRLGWQQDRYGCYLCLNQ